MPQKSLDELYFEEIKDLYDAEKRIVKTLPKLAKGSSSGSLQSAFNEHLQKSEEHVRRLEQIFEGFGKKASAKTCNGIKGILEEGSEAFDLDRGPTRDAALIGGAQRVEHYEIAAYGTLVAWANLLGRNKDIRLLEQTLEEEKEADRTLSKIAESEINEEAEARHPMSIER
jgi:ferritin-like metal-binding protein YciE